MPSPLYVRNGKEFITLNGINELCNLGNDVDISGSAASFGALRQYLFIAFIPGDDAQAQPDDRQTPAITNNDGVDLSVVNENLGIWIERTLVDLGDAAIEALKDRADAKISKDQLSVRDATTPILQNKRLNSIRHYNTDVDGDEFVGGNGFNAVDKWDYQNPEDYRTPRGVDPKAVSQVDDNMYFLRFDFPETDKLPVLMVSWRGHPSNNGGATDGRISSDYVNSFCHALEYGCEVTFDTTNGFLTGWTLGTTRKYRAAFFQGTGGNVNVRSDELITYPGICLLPLLFQTVEVSPIWGVWWSLPICDALAAIIAAIVLNRDMRKLSV